MTDCDEKWLIHRHKSHMGQQYFPSPSPVKQLRYLIFGSSRGLGRAGFEQRFEKRDSAKFYRNSSRCLNTSFAVLIDFLRNSVKLDENYK